MLKNIISPTGHKFADGFIIGAKLTLLVQPWFIHYGMFQYVIAYVIVNAVIIHLDLTYGERLKFLYTLAPWAKYIPVITLPIAGTVYWHLIEKLAW